MRAPVSDKFRLALTAAALGIVRGGCPPDVLSSRVPWLREQIEADAAAERFSAWAGSTVLDGKLSTPVIPPSLFATLHSLAGIVAQWPIGNAGVLHVYGYLLSLAMTAHGPKSERWLSGELASALCLPTDHFTPWLRGPSTVLERVQRAALPALLGPGDAAGLCLCTEESGTSGGLTVSARTIVLRDPASGHGVVIYGVASGSEEQPLLVTMFPADVADGRWVDSFLAGPTRLRFNAAVPGFAPRAPLMDRQVIFRS